MSIYLVTGASRGIGLELIGQLVQLPTSKVSKIFALSRSEPSGQLASLIDDEEDRIVHVTASVEDTASVLQAAEDVKGLLNGKGLDILVNNAGAANFSSGGISTCTEQQLNGLFDTNVVGVQRVTAAFLPLLEAGKEKKVINMSTTMGSISWAHKWAEAPNYAYKISKAALNMLTQQYALEYADAGFTFLSISPGDGVTDVKRIILESDPTYNGKFLNIHVLGQENAYGQYDGKEFGRACITGPSSNGKVRRNCTDAASFRLL
nr:putative oxidoreductase [Quercus suber]